MIVRLISAVVVLAGLIAIPSIASAGGWASVRTDDPLTQAVANLPWQVTVTVRQHDREPVDVDEISLTASERETGTTVVAMGSHAAGIGQYRFDVTFPVGGEWKWSVSPAPFPTVGMPTLTVASELAGSLSTASAGLHADSCIDPGSLLVDLGVIPIATADRGPTQTTIDIPAADLTDFDGPSSLVVATTDGGVLACGEFPVKPGEAVTSFALQPGPTGDVAGLALLVMHDDGVTVDLTLVAVPASGAGPAANAADSTVVISDSLFTPNRIEIAAGDTVTWVNQDVLAHTISSDDPVFDNSGMIDPGGSYSETFMTPGVYPYRCDPHPGMDGVIVVS